MLNSRISRGNKGKEAHLIQYMRRGNISEDRGCQFAVYNLEYFDGKLASDRRLTFPGSRIYKIELSDGATERSMHRRCHTIFVIGCPCYFMQIFMRMLCRCAKLRKHRLMFHVSWLPRL